MVVRQHDNEMQFQFTFNDNSCCYQQIFSIFVCGIFNVASTYGVSSLDTLLSHARVSFLLLPKVAILVYTTTLLEKEKKINLYISIRSPNRKTSEEIVHNMFATFMFSLASIFIFKTS